MMMKAIDQPTTMQYNPTLPRQIFNYLWRATWLKCPVCGTRPLFLPLRSTRRLNQWFTPLDWCPNCRYIFEREPGYFLMSQWAIGYGAAALVGIIIYIYLQLYHSDWSMGLTMLVVAFPMPFVNVLFARHAKAYFLAIDHLADPHIRSLEDGYSTALNGTDINGSRAVANLIGGEAGDDPAGQPGSGIPREEQAGMLRDS